MTAMKKKLHYRGVAYDYRPVDIAGKLKYLLYQEGIVVHVMPQEELDKRSMGTLALDRYYSAPKSKKVMEVLR
jgi:hypothetical protein